MYLHVERRWRDVIQRTEEPKLPVWAVANGPTLGAQ